MVDLSTTYKVKNSSNRLFVHNRSSMLLLCTVLLGILANVLFFDQFPGISYPIFVIAFYCVFLWNARDELHVKVDFGWLLLIPIFLLSLSYFVFSNLIFYALNFMAIPVLIVMQTTLTTRRANEKWYSIKFIGDLFLGFFYRPFAFIALPFRVVIKQATARVGIRKDSTFLKVIIGVLVAVPLLILIISLLASADQVFSYLVDRIPNLFVTINLDTIVPRTLFAAIIALLSFSYIWSLMKPKTTSAPFWKMSEPMTVNNRVDHVIAVTILSLINAIYVLFTLIQFSYLFGSFSFALPAEFTYAEYARRGFFELVVVTLINFSILLVIVSCTKKGGKAINKAMQLLESLLVFCTLVMLLSAFVRMFLYEQMYGYTYLRVLTHAFMIFLFGLFIVTLCRIWKENLRLYKFYLLAAIAALVIINYMNIDVLITKWNIDRYEQTGKIDVNYLATLSDDAIPTMTVLLSAKDDTVAGQIENYLFERKRELAKKRSWQSFNLSQYRAMHVLDRYDLSYNARYAHSSESDQY
ncbi:DUF4153 domain-containing protein [Sporolactobacillus laevolacticus]|uniref:Uncharacterized protein n=1 Tax=Sporolactobacillus laevolacticus DSM 442 TaxID=1395513 RepID=V6J0P4_9BACL|nr:DUF4173 domain-containing protein [Sporolactobacillus laevolacticus]EST13483.1 hypothetical protein P343_01585 [Sporolactobacillus laevolacticus DSM 442]